MRKRGYFVDKLRVWSGFIVFAYVTTHLLNHTLGLFSLDLLEQSRRVFLGFWRSPPLNYLVVAALLVHAVLAVTKLLQRKSFRGLSAKEWTQLVVGVLIPVGLIGHVWGTKVAHELHGIDDTYSYYMLVGGLSSITVGVIFTLLAWAHGVIGIDGVLLTKRWYEPWRRRLAVPTLLLPILAVAGAVSAYHQITLLAALDRAFYGNALRDVVAMGHTQATYVAMMEKNADPLTLAYVLVIASLLALRFAYVSWRRRHRAVNVSYPDGREVQIAPGTSVLEASLMGRIPHAHLCGGRGRCSTCRVRVYAGCETLSPPSPVEQRVLRQIGAAENVRLACQAFPQADCRVIPLLPTETNLRNYADKRFLQGSDRKIAILFADLRGFTSFSEHRLPFDVVFVLNQYFQAVGKAIEARGGYLDKFIGDGAMALFGIDVPLKTACRQAVEAAWEMGQELEKLNRRLSSELPQPLKIGIGLHCGDAIVAKMGYKHTSHLTAIGDAVNTASRLESLTKDFDAQLLVSAEVATRAGLDLSDFATTEVAIRGKTNSLHTHVIPRVRDLPVEELPTKVRAAQPVSA